MAVSPSGSRGKFISLEGGEGTGKSTQARRLQAWLAERGIDATLTREPGGSPHAECLRELLLSGRVAPFGTDAEALVFAIARADHVAQTIRPALDVGTWVICDRFIDSTRAYQGTAGVPGDRIRELETIAAGDTLPDLTIILDIPVEEGLRRASARNEGSDRFEKDDLTIHEARRQAFLSIAKAEPNRCVCLDASGAENRVFGRICDAVSDRLQISVRGNG